MVMKFPLFIFSPGGNLSAGNMTMDNQDGNDKDNDEDNAQV